MQAHNVTMTLEQLTPELYQELCPLGQRCWDECSTIKGVTCAFHGERGFIIEPDAEQYLSVAKQNALIVATLRDGMTLHGYSLGILYRSLHHKPIIVGNVDSFYIEPDYRQYASVLIKKMESEFESRGVVIVGWPTSPDGPLFSVLKELGYIPDDVIMEKRLCALPSQ